MFAQTYLSKKLGLLRYLTHNTSKTFSFSFCFLLDKLCELPDIQHGGIVCNHGDISEGDCSVVCDTDYVVNPIRIFRRAFNCKHPDELESMVTAMKTQSPCLCKLHGVDDTGDIV